MPAIQELSRLKVLALRKFVEAQEAGLMKMVPKLVAVEPGARLERVMAGDDYRSVFEVPNHNMTSIGGGTVTYQSLKALQSSGSTAVTVSSSQALQHNRSSLTADFTLSYRQRLRLPPSRSCKNKAC